MPVTVSDGTTRGLGITADSTQAFGAGATPLPVLSPTRHTTGTRIDQFLLFEGVYPAEYLTRARIVVPLFMNTTLITWNLSLDLEQTFPITMELLRPSSARKCFGLSRLDHSYRLMERQSADQTRPFASDDLRSPVIVKRHGLSSWTPT